MKKTMKRGLALLLILILSFSFMSTTALADENEQVLSAISHINCSVQAANIGPTTRSVTLQVPFIYSSNTIDLAAGLSVTKGPNIEQVTTIFESGSVASIGTSTIPMTVQYKRKNNDTLFSTIYYIKVTKAAKVNSTFSGTITKSAFGTTQELASSSNEITFSRSEFESLFKANDGGALRAIRIKGNNLVCGALLFNGTEYASGTEILITDLDKLVFNAVTSGEVTYLCEAITVNGDTAKGQVSLRITVGQVSVPTISSAVNKSVAVGSTLNFSLNDFSGKYDLKNGTLDKIEIKPDTTSSGVWYNGSVVISGSAIFSSTTISNLKFTANANGAGSASFSWRVSNEAGYSEWSSGIVAISSISVPTITSAVTKSISQGSTAYFTISDFSSCYNINNGTLQNIEITPINSGYGTWYNGTTPFTSPTVFTSATINNLRFVSTTAGAATFSWRVSNQSGYSTSGSGSISIGTSSNTGLNYTTAVNTPVKFNSSDFSSAFYSATGQSLYYVVFTLPQAYYGTLYYNYSVDSIYNPVTSDIAYVVGYSQNHPSLDNIYFVPSSNYSGSLTISYTGYTSSGTSYSGFVQITVGAASGTSGLTYTTPANTPVAFRANDFANAFYNATGKTLSYVTFNLPSSYYGTLYYNYSIYSANNPVTSNTAYYVNYTQGSQSLDLISFVPSTNYSGTVTITYIGYTALGIPYSGSIQINVGSGSSSGYPGSVTYTTPKDTAVTFKSTDFYNAFYSATGMQLSHVSFTLPSSSFGTLYYNYASTSGLNPVSSSTPYYVNSPQYIDYITFVPTTNYTGTITISYTGYSTNGFSSTGILQINVGTSGTGSLTYTTAKNTPVTFKSVDLANAFYNATGTVLSQVYFTQPSATYGTLYYNYTSSLSANPVSPVTPYYTNTAPYIDSVSFIPASNFTGTVTISYTGYNINGNSITGTIQINVGSTGTGSITYSTSKNTPVTFKSTDFANAFYNATGTILSQVFFSQPSALYGTLYYNYTSSLTANPVSPVTAYYTNATPLIDSVTFVPASNYSGTVTLTYTGYNVNGISTTGTIQINVGTTGTGSLTYTTAKNSPVTFKSTDFANAFYNATGTVLSQVFFTQPSATYGTLYYNYAVSLTTNPVSPVTAYYTNATPLIDNITFVPASNYTGTVTISYTGYSVSGTPVQGTVQINVGSSGTNTVTYITAKNTAVAFKSNDFATAFYNTTGTVLSQVFFILPPATSGTLYYNYSGSTTPNPVSAITAYYAGSTVPSLDLISFVPATNYTGTVSISFTGFNINGASTTGTIQITVDSTSSETCSVTYTTDKDKAVTFKASDFSTAFNTAAGTSLSYVYFTLPSATSGTLYYNYTASSTANTAVTATTQYNVNSSPYLSYISFVPAKGYTGTVTIPFKGYGANGISCSGNVTITVKNTTASNPSFTDMGNHSWAVDAVNYLFQKQIITGTGNNKFSPSSNIKKGDYILMLYRAFNFKAQTGKNYNDVPKNSYYYEAIAVAKALGITRETGDYFYPEVPLTRQDAMYYTYRALQLSGNPLPAGTANDIAKFTDRSEISGYALEAIQALVKAGIVTGSNSKLSPLSNLSRAEMAAILYRALTV